MKRKILLVILLTFAIFLIYAVFAEPAMLGFTTHEVSIKGLPQQFDGFKIVQISDVHINRWMTPQHVRGIVERVNALNPDMVVLTGDYVSRGTEYCSQVGGALGGLKAKHGVYAVLGNHDYWTDSDAVTKSLREGGINVLFDERHTISVEGKHITLIGTDDEWEGNPDYKKAFDGVTPHDICIAIAHNPDAVFKMEGKPVALLMAGHTHGGIINLPVIGSGFSVTHLGQKAASGMMTIKGVRMYVSRGIGCGPVAHIRFRSQPEIPIFTLRAE